MTTVKMEKNCMGNFLMKSRKNRIKYGILFIEYERSLRLAFEAAVKASYTTYRQMVNKLGAGVPRCICFVAIVNGKKFEQHVSALGDLSEPDMTIDLGYIDI